MSRYELPEHHDAAPRGFFARHRAWIVPLLVMDAALVGWWLLRTDPQRESEIPAVAEAPATVSEQAGTGPVATKAAGNHFGYPTRQAAILDTNIAGVFMPTASGRPESAMYGTVRMAKEGNLVMPSFHEGIDIAPMERDRRQMPTDRVFASVAGEVVYANRIAGNSNYGRYVVLMHDDPVGKIFTLYAHLEEIAPSIRPGHVVAKGEDIGRMGHSDSTGLDISRAHLHFEVGMMLNRNFHGWYKKQKRKPDHGNYHGQNLMGINPIDVFRWQQEKGAFSMRDYLAQLTPAFTLVVKTGHPFEYFARYPGLWSGGPHTGVMVVSVSEGGVPAAGRPATPEEARLVSAKRHAVLAVNPDVLGKNGLRLIVRRQGNWQLGKNGERWLEILSWR